MIVTSRDNGDSQSPDVCFQCRSTGVAHIDPEHHIHDDAERGRDDRIPLCTVLVRTLIANEKVVQRDERVCQ